MIFLNKFYMIYLNDIFIYINEIHENHIKYRILHKMRFFVKEKKKIVYKIIKNILNSEI